MPTDAQAVVVIGASAGGITALPRLVRQLPAELPAAVLIVQHLFAEMSSALPEILARAGTLPARHARDGEQIEAGTIYVARPDYHLLLDANGLIELSHGARENLHRPAIDVLFRSAARAYGRRTVGVLLTGTRDDGAAGLLAIKMRGGVAIVQDPEDADFAEMPQRALEFVDDIDYVIPLAAIPTQIMQVVQQLVAMPEHEQRLERYASMRGMSERHASMRGMNRVETMVEQTQPDTLVCPECGGALKQHEQGRLLQYYCHVGHAFGLESLRGAYGQKIEETLWAALRALKEQNALLHQMSTRTSNARLREEYLKQAEAGEEHARDIRLLLQHLESTTTPGMEA
jgi:two-component system chemotaxis response regulator CheB